MKHTTTPAYYDIAMGEIGTREVPGSGSSRRIDEYLGSVGLSGDETPWCAAFINWSLGQVKIAGTNSATARSFEHWGADVPIHEAREGDIVVLKRGNSSWQGHVAMFVEWVQLMEDEHGSVSLLGGNQHDAVSIATFQTHAIICVRRPKKASDSKTIAAAAAASALTVANTAANTLNAALTTTNTALDQGADMIAKTREISTKTREIAEVTSEFATQVIPAQPTTPLPEPVTALVSSPIYSGISTLNVVLMVVTLGLIAFIILERHLKITKKQV